MEATGITQAPKQVQQEVRTSSIESAILRALAEKESVSTMDLAKQLGVDHQDVVGSTKSLEGEEYLVSEMISLPQWKLTNEAQQICEKGSPEFLLWEMLSNGEIAQPEIQATLGKEAAAVAVSNGMKAKIFTTTKKDGVAFIGRNASVSSFEDRTRDVLNSALQGGHVDPKDIDMIKKRKLGSLDAMKVFILKRGSNYSEERRSKPIGDITKEMLLDGSWQTANFKKYNFAADGREVNGGNLNPLLKVRQEFREIFMELGFQEMETQQWVEKSFWNFDALFIPQHHPARDMQDTFFVSKPASASVPFRDYLDRVRKMHETSFKSSWSEEEAERNILRTHTTGSTAYWLYHLAQNSPMGADGVRQFTPGRYYSIDRVFRNEQVDRTHLCEFHQCEGCIIDRGISLAMMMHLFSNFFKRIGIERLRFKPTFNPYTEPSMEIFGYHTGLKKWMEVGNSGMFRPEMLEAAGFDSGVSAIAWGLSLERPTMIKYGITNIHELFGHRVDLRFIKRSAIARF